MSEKSKSFEASVERLDAIVKQMEQGSVSLEEALKLFEEGTGLIRGCSQMLEQAEMQVVQLMKSADGTPAETEYVRDE